ncbi:MAG: hypothetical protein JWM07_413 [Candidatus Saccharibacteria bacterium]|nr:hypothetical protein [Candidatus Saccharibacteria bacterium]
MDNVPVNANGPAAEGRHAGRPVDEAHHNTPRGKKKPKNLKYILMAAVVSIALLLVLLGGWMLYRSSMGAHIDGNKYQAVFFTNGQVYFGKLEKLSGGYFKLNDIFYLQAKADAADASGNPQETSTQQNSDVELIKLGSEVHGPDDEMIISKDQVLFFENLKKDGTVSQSITNFKNPK